MSALNDPLRLICRKTNQTKPYINLYLGELVEGSRLRREGSQVLQEILEEGRRVHWPKRCIDNNKDEDNSLNNPNST